MRVVFVFSPRVTAADYFNFNRLLDENYVRTYATSVHEQLLKTQCNVKRDQ